MFGYLNKCEFIGRLGAEPESRNTQNGEKVVNFRIAVSESWKDKNTGERRERTEWVGIVIWNQAIGNVAMNHVKKGNRIYVSGRMQTRKWQDQNGNDRYTTEVVLPQYGGDLQILENRQQSDAPAAASSPSTAQSGTNTYSTQSAGLSNNLDDEVPF